MLLQPSDAPPIVCTTILCRSQGNYTGDNWASVVAAKVNGYFPHRHLTAPDIHEDWAHVQTKLFDGTQFVRGINKSCQGWKIMTRHLDAGLLESKSLPDAPITTEGVKITMARIVGQARQRGVENGLLRRRSFERTERNEELGYDTDYIFLW